MEECKVPPLSHTPRSHTYQVSSRLFSCTPNDYAPLSAATLHTASQVAQRSRHGTLGARGARMVNNPPARTRCLTVRIVFDSTTSGRVLEKETRITDWPGAQGGHQHPLGEAEHVL